MKNLLEQRCYDLELAHVLVCETSRIFRDQDVVESNTEGGRRYYWIKRKAPFQEFLNLRKHLNETKHD